MPDIEDQIRRAIEDGKFDDLPGKGKPLHLDENPLVDPEWRLAQHLLKSSGYTLPWIEKRQEIQAELEAARYKLLKTWQWRNDSLAAGRSAEGVEQEWQRARQAFQRVIGELNLKIRDYNLEAPAARFQIQPLNAERDIAAACGVSG
jgi:DnaJ family protein C protein 28